MNNKNEIIETEVVEPTLSNELTIQNSNVKKLVQENKKNKCETTITTNNGVLKQTNYENGVTTHQSIVTPSFNDNYERDKAICDLYKDGHKQNEIAESMGLSQSRVSQIIRKNK